MEYLEIRVREFSTTPGARVPQEGIFSGQEFRENVLRPKFDEATKVNKKILVDLDGTIGYGTSWLEEVFGGLARATSPEQVLEILEFISDEEPYLIEDIRGYIKNA